MKLFDKDPQANLDYGINWGPWLANEADTIATVTWNVPAGLTVTGMSPPQAWPTVWLSGGTLGQAYAVTCHIVTAAGRTNDRTFTVRITDQ